MFMAQLDATIVVVALPSMQADFGIGPGVGEWVVLGYMLPLIAMALPGGRWLDGVGRRPALLVSAAGFAAASVAAGLSPGMWWLLCGRVLQGAFAAILFALLPVLTTEAVRPQNRGRAMGVVMTLGSLGGVAGPLIGGILVGTLGWRWIFYLTAPPCVALMVIGWRQLAGSGRLRWPGRDWIVEATLIGTASVAVMLGFSLAVIDGFGWLLLAIAAVPLVIFWLRLPNSQPVLGLIRQPRMAAAHVGLLTGMAAIMVVQFLAPFYLGSVLHLAPAMVGVSLLTFPLGVVVFGPIAGLLADRWSSWSVTAAGAVISGVGLLLLIPLGSAWTPFDFSWRLAVLGVGVGLVATANQTMAMSIAPRSLLGTTAASMSLTRHAATALGPALATIIWAMSGYTAGGMRSAIAMAASLGLISMVALGFYSRPRTTRSASTPVAVPA
jgi:MFS family permease